MIFSPPSLKNTGMSSPNRRAGPAARIGMSMPPPNWAVQKAPPKPPTRWKANPNNAWPNGLTLRVCVRSALRPGSRTASHHPCGGSSCPPLLSRFLPRPTKRTSQLGNRALPRAPRRCTRRSVLARLRCDIRRREQQHQPETDPYELSRHGSPKTCGCLSTNRPLVGLASAGFVNSRTPRSAQEDDSSGSTKSVAGGQQPA